MTRILNWLIAIPLALVPAVASAHVGVGDTNGFVHGFSHPLSGLDHILAMVAVGLFAVRLGGRALWLVPLTFVSVVAVAGVLGMAGVGLPYVEIGIGISLIVLGTAIALQLNIPTLAAMGLVGFFAIFHGHATGWKCRKARRVRVWRRVRLRHGVASRRRHRLRPNNWVCRANIWPSYCSSWRRRYGNRGCRSACRDNVTTST